MEIQQVMHRLLTKPIPTLTSTRRYFDIAANLADHMFEGVYHGKPAHEADVGRVIDRAREVGVDRMLIVGGYIEDTVHSAAICKGRHGFYTTVGVHPCRANVGGFGLTLGSVQARKDRRRVLSADGRDD